MVDVNERAEARHDYRCVNGTVIGASGAGSGVGSWQSPLAIAFLRSLGLWPRGQGGLPGGANSSGPPKSPAAAISERRRSTPSGVSRCSRNPVDRGFAAPGTVGSPPPDQPPVGVHPSAGSTVSFPFGSQGDPVQDLELPARRAARRRSYWRQADEAIAEDEVAHTADRGRCDGGGRGNHGERDDEPASAGLPNCACPTENVVPASGKRLGRQQGESSAQQAVVVRAHAVTSFVVSSAASCSWAWDRVAATVPSAMPSTSPICA